MQRYFFLSVERSSLTSLFIGDAHQWKCVLIFLVQWSFLFRSMLFFLLTVSFFHSMISLFVSFLFFESFFKKNVLWLLWFVTWCSEIHLSAWVLTARRRIRKWERKRTVFPLFSPTFYWLLYSFFFVCLFSSEMWSRKSVCIERRHSRSFFLFFWLLYIHILIQRLLCVAMLDDIFNYMDLYLYTSFFWCMCMSLFLSFLLQ